MKTTLTLLLTLLASLGLGQPVFDWIGNYSHNFSDYGRALEVDEDGNMYFAGYSASFGTPTGGFIVTKMDSVGNVVWEHDGDVLLLSPPDHVGAYEIGIDSLHNVYALIHVNGGTTYNNDTLAGTDALYLLKFDPNGNPLWYLKLSDPVFVNNASDVFLETTAGGDCYVAATFAFQEIFGNDTLNSAGNGDVFLSKVNTNGSFEWSKSFGGPNNCNDQVVGVGLDNDDNIFIHYIICGWGTRFIHKYNPAGVEVMQHEVPVYSSFGMSSYRYFADGDGNSYIAGYQQTNQISGYGTTISNTNGESLNILKLDSNANYVSHAVVFDTTNIANINPYKVYADEAQNMYLAGKAWGTVYGITDTINSEYFVTSNDINGNFNWVKAFGEGGTSSTYGRVRDILVKNNDLYMIASIEGFPDITIDGTTMTPDWSDILLGKMCKFLPASPDFSFTQNGASIAFTNLSQNYDSLYWDFGDGNTSTQPNPNHVYSANGTYNACVVVNNICGSISHCETIQVNGVGISETSANHQINIAPNPFSEQFTLTVHAPAYQQGAHISIFNVLGEKVHQQRFSGTSVVIDAAVLRAGVYLYQVTTPHADIPAVGRLVKR